MGESRIGVVGAGLVGLAVARQLQARRPGAEITVWDKEDRVAAHQSGRNSGVVHAGVYYPPGSLKAVLCRRGNTLLREFCAAHDVEVAELGKLVVAASRDEVPALGRVMERAQRNGVPDVGWLEGADIAGIEPYAAGVAAIHSPHTAVVDFRAVAAALADDIRAAGGRVVLGSAVEGVVDRGDAVGLRVAGRPEEVDRLVVCAGLGTDRVAPAAGGAVRTVSFRGEYHRLAEPAARRVRGLIYPVPDPALPFLGVHLTRTATGEVLAGPNAVPALAMEGYRRRDIDPRVVAGLALWPGGRRLARAQWRAGAHELRSSLSKATFAAAARRYLPSLRTHDLRPAPAGVRAQAVDRRGRLLDDFVIDGSDRLTVVRNAPSPAATSSLAIAEHLVERLLGAPRS